MSDAIETDGIPCTWMRGGTSKGAFFLAEHLPSDPTERNALLLRIMGSPDPVQIDGIGGADPLASKAAVIKTSARPDADIDYLFLQVFVDRAVVSDAQACGNILAGVGPFAIEQGLLPAKDGETPVRIHMENTGETALARVTTPGGKVSYSGETAIAGVPGTHAPVPLLFQNIAGSMCGALLPTGNETDRIDGLEVTLIDNGMPCVILRAADLGLSGTESREEIDGNEALKARLENIRLQAGPLMNLDSVSDKSVPKMVLVSPPFQDGTLSTRCLIPHRCHASIGVFAGTSVAAACCLSTGPAAACARLPESSTFRIEHPSGAMDVLIERDASGAMQGAGLLRTARKLFEGHVFPGPARIESA